MNAPPSLGKVEQIRARDGDACWGCAGKLDFNAEPNSKKAPTIEHLVAKSLGGGGEMANLVLCHSGCNVQLGNRTLAEKQKLRAKWLGNTAKVAAKVSAAKPPAASKPPAAPKPLGKADTATMVAQASVLPTGPSLPAATRSELAVEVAYWRRLALIGGGGGLMSAGFAVGLCVGLLLS
jgi:hypothetical protein